MDKHYFLDIEKNYHKKNEIERALYDLWSSGEDDYDRAVNEEQAQRAADELAKLAGAAEGVVLRTQKLERVAKIAKQIFKVTNRAFSQKSAVACPHGNSPLFPAHAWWCDSCWFEMRDALAELETETEDEQKAG